MTGRVVDVSIDYWTAEELAEIPTQGFPVLNVQPSSETANRFVEECLASPHLMQEFCRQLCDANGIEETQALHRRVPHPSSIDTLFERVAGDTCKTVFERLAKGPRQRSDRNQREFKEGGAGDIYVAVLHAMADLKPGMTT